MPTAPTAGKPWSAARHAVVAGALGALVGGVFLASAVERSTSSTAAVGYLFLPILALIYWGLPAALAGWCLGYLRGLRAGEVPASKPRTVLAGATLALIAGYATTSLFRGVFLSEKVAQVRAMKPAELTELLASPMWGKNKFILGAVAQSPKATPEILQQIASINDPELHQAMGSVFNLLGDNKKGLAVMRLVAAHPQVRPETLEQLAKSPDDYVLGDVARSAKVSEATLRVLAQRGGQLIDWGLAANPRTPADILVRLSHSEDASTRADVAQNPNTPVEELVRLAKDVEPHVRGSVRRNPSAPVDLVAALKEDQAAY